MTTSTFEIFCVTNRKLCKTDFLSQIDKLAECHPNGIILREKDLSHDDYKTLAKKVMAICKKHNVPCFLHTFAEVAARLGATGIHMPLSALANMTDKQKSRFWTVGTSCHSVSDAVFAQQCGCKYIIAGHVFDTDCKKDLPGRGIEFLDEICNSTNLPIYAIGGIKDKNISAIAKTKAKGVCVMSSAMTCDDAKQFFANLRRNI